MKKTLFSSAAILLTGLLFGSQAMAQGRIDLGRTQPVQQCANVTQDGFTASFSFGSVNATEVSTEKGAFSEITMEGTYPSGNVGEPSLPAAHQLIALPYGAKNVSLEVKSFSTTTYRLADYGIKTLKPQQPSVRKDQKPEDIKFVYDEKAYTTRTSRPVAELELQGNLRGIGVGSLTVNPVNYNPAEGTITVYNDIEVEVRYNEYDKGAAESEFVRTFSPYFAGVYRTMFNWRDDFYDQHPDLWKAPVKMLVIANRMFEECMQEWIEWKTMKGFYMNVNYTDDIGSTPAAIRSFIQSEYDKDAPTFVIVFGDKEQVAASATGSQSEKVTDLYYMTVDNDYYPDILHSRMCAQTVEQMQNILTKTLMYERYEMPDPSYLNNVLLIAGWDSYWTAYDGAPTIQYAMEYYYNAEHGFNEVNHWLGQPYTNCYASLNTGVGFANYTAHGDNDMWADPSLSVSNVNNFTNEGKPFLAMGNCCLAANWGHSSTCFGEAMIRNNTRGAFAYIGSCPNTYWYEDYYFGVGATNVFGQMPTYEQTKYGAYDAIWDDDAFNTVSAIPFIGNIAVCYSHTGGYQGSVSDLYYWQAYHALGDGSVMPFRVQPTENNVNHMPTLPIGVNFFTVSAAPGSYAAISKDGVLYGAGLIGESGTADISIEPILEGGDVTICVTGLDKIPYINQIPAASTESAYIVYNDVQCDNPVSGASVNPAVTLKNVGVETASNINVSLSTESEYITLTNATSTVASIAPDATATINDFSFDVANNIPDGTRIQFFVTCVSGDDTWESKFYLNFMAPNLAVSNISNSELQAGGTGSLSLDIANNGGADADNLILEIYSSSDDITFNNIVVEIGTLASHGTAVIDLQVSVANGVEEGSTYEIPYLLSAGHYSVSGSYTLSVGNLVEGFETGDMSMYAWQTSNNAWSVVSNEANTGTYSVRSGAISDNQQTDLTLTTNILSNGEVSFFKKVSSENGYDKLFFYIDNTEKGSWSGEVAWSQESYMVTAGTHTFTWRYKKDVSVSSGSDCAWVDDIQFPPTNVVTAIEAVTNLQAVVEGNTVALTWDGTTNATSYVIRRNGEEIANQAGTSYDDNVADGTYTYSVIAKDDNGHSSAAAYVTVNVGLVGVEESLAEDIAVYPNPASGVLNINGGNAEYSYALFNGMGQTIANGNAQGAIQINLGDMAKGIYILRLTTGTQVRVEKIVVK